MTRRPRPATVTTTVICAATCRPKTPPHEPRSRNDARRNAIDGATQPLLASTPVEFDVESMTLTHTDEGFDIDQLLDRDTD